MPGTVILFRENERFRLKNHFEFLYLVRALKVHLFQALEIFIQQPLKNDFQLNFYFQIFFIFVL